MTVPKPRINTFMEEDTRKINIDPVSKVFITAELILGLNRNNLIGVTAKCYKAFFHCYTVLFNITIFYLFIEPQFNNIFWTCVAVPDFLKFLACSVLGCLLRNRIRNFYRTITVLDKELGFDITKLSIREPVYNIVQMIITIIVFLTLKFYYNEVFDHPARLSSLIIRVILNCFEMHFYVHLFSVVVHRLKLFNGLLRIFYPIKRIISPFEDPIQTEDIQNVAHMDMKKFMDLYNKIIVTHDSLIEAIKWQVLAVLMTTFLITLLLSFHFVRITMKQDQWTFLTDVVPDFSYVVVELMPLLLLCVLADRVHEEVRLASDLLACRIYENTLDKSNRHSARILLALTKTRQLKFSLFHMFDVDISLPFKYLALLLTYLIILLQFDKVISPND